MSDFKSSKPKPAWAQNYKEPVKKEPIPPHTGPFHQGWLEHQDKVNTVGVQNYPKEIRKK